MRLNLWTRSDENGPTALLVSWQRKNLAASVSAHVHDADDIVKKKLSIALPRIDRKLGWGKTPKIFREPARMHDRMCRGAQTEASLLATGADARSIYILSKSDGPGDLARPTHFAIAITLRYAWRTWRFVICHDD